jgi:hypothetical protein
MSASSTSDDTVGRVEKDPVVNQRASTTIESPEPTRDSSNAVTPTPALGSAEPASPAPSARTQTSGKPVVNFHFAPQ